jgi:hypothetical protein
MERRPDAYAVAVTTAVMKASADEGASPFAGS